MKMLIVLAAAASLVACAPAVSTDEPVRSVKVVTAAPTAVDLSHEYAGEVRARTESRLGFRVSGKLLERDAQVGQRVGPQDVLARLDAQDFALAQQAAAAQLQAAQTQRDLAAADLRRFQELQRQGFISGAEIERRQATLRSADSALAQARSQVSLQGNQMAYTVLRSGVAGVVVAVEAEPGQVLSAGTSVVRLAHDGARDVVFAVPEDRLAGVRLGQPAQVRLWAGGERVVGVVREIAASADPQTRTFQVKVSLNGAGLPLSLGATAYAELGAAPEAAPQAIKLPTSALRQAGAATAVWVWDPATGAVRSQEVQIATADGNEAVIAGGLKGGEQVVVAGVHVLFEGQKVTLYQPPGSAAGRPSAAPPAALPAASPAVAASGSTR